MKIERLKSAIDEMTSIIDEMQSEVYEFNARKCDWYGRHLKLYRSGLMSKTKFETSVWDEYQKMYTMFDDDLYVLSRQFLNLERRYEEFKKIEEYMKDLDKCSLSKPADWKEWEVEFKDSLCDEVEKCYLYGPNREHAIQMCLYGNEDEYNKVEILNVREVKHG